MLIPALAVTAALEAQPDHPAWEPWLAFALPGSIQLIRGEWLAGGLLAGSSALLLGAQLAGVSREQPWGYPIAQLTLAGTSAWMGVRPVPAQSEQAKLGGSALGWIQADGPFDTRAVHGLADPSRKDPAVR